MHAAAREFIGTQTSLRGPFDTVVEFGSRDVNGGVRDLFAGADYHGVDLAPGPGVDEVADAAGWRSGQLVDCVVCCEVLEHTSDAAGIISAAYRALLRGGVLLLTAACDPRAAHSAVDGGPLGDGEYYGNVDPDQLVAWLDAAGFAHWEVYSWPWGDVQAVALR